MTYINREGNPVSLGNLIAELEASTGEHMAESAVQHRIWSAVDRLPAEERYLINMIYFREEMRRSDAELAAELGIDGPELSRARRRILNKLIKSLRSAGVFPDSRPFTGAEGQTALNNG